MTVTSKVDSTTAFATPFVIQPFSTTSLQLSTPRRPRSFHSIPYQFKPSIQNYPNKSITYATQQSPLPADHSSYLKYQSPIETSSSSSFLPDHSNTTKPNPIPITIIPSSNQTSSKWARLRIPILVALAAVPFILLSILPSAPSPTRLITNLTQHILHMGTTRASIALSLLNFFTVLFCFPANMGLMIGAGALLGPVPAFIALFASKLVAACAAFSLARLFFYQRAQNWLSNHPRMAKVLLESGRTGGWKFVLLMRLSPFPGFMLNYLLSVTGVSLMEYFMGTLVGIAPSVLNLVLIGATAKDVSLGVAKGSVAGGWFPFITKTICALSMIAVTIFVTKKTREVFDDVHVQNDQPIGSENVLGEDASSSHVQI